MLESFYKLLEGGNVFKGDDKQPLTTRISKDDIAASLHSLEQALGFKLETWLGTTGKKATSGDIDVSVDDSKHDRKEVAKNLKVFYKEQGLKPAEWVKLSGDNVHVRVPIISNGQDTGEFVQVDLMFGNPQFQSWSMRGETGKYKGMHRHILLASIAKAISKGAWKWSYKHGIVDRKDNSVVANDPDDIIDMLLPGYTGDANKVSVESIMDFLYTHYSMDEVEAMVGEAATTLAEIYKVSLPGPNGQEVHESNDTDTYFVARLRDRIINLDMEPLIENTKLFEAKMRDINHLEDLVLDGGPKGLIRAIKLLDAFAKGKAHSATTIKWDGSPAIVFGRDENGQFILTDKSGWTAKGYDGKAKSKEHLKQMFLNRKATLDDNRKQFINNMVSIYDEFERATPKDFRGFMSGDLMYYTQPPLKDGAYVFRPNVVEYRVHAKSEMGQRIGQSKTGIVVHKYIGNQYKDAADASKAIGGNEVFVMPPVTVQQPAKLNTKGIEQIKKMASSPELKTIFSPEGLKGMSDLFHGLVYSYINQTVDRGLENLGLEDFGHWVQGNSKLTDKKRERILGFIKEHAKGFGVLFATIKGVMAVKDNLVAQFDAHPSDVEQNIGGQPGGEGYVVKDAEGAVKLVPRGKFTAANRALHR